MILVLGMDESSFLDLSQEFTWDCVAHGCSLTYNIHNIVIWPVSITFQKNDHRLFQSKSKEPLHQCLSDVCKEKCNNKL